MFTHVQLGVIALTLGSSMPKSVLLFFCTTASALVAERYGAFHGTFVFLSSC